MATEADGQSDDEPTAHSAPGPATRMATARLVVSFADRGIRSSVVRLPPTVQRDGDNGFMATLVGVARKQGVSGYIGDGSNRRPAVHRADAAQLFRLAVEQAPGGSVLHGVAEEGVPLRSIAEVIGAQLDLPVVSVAPDAAAEHFGWLATFLGADIPASSEITQDLLDWHPTQPGLLDDLQDFYAAQRA